MSLSIIYAPQDATTSPAVDIVAVHGIGGDAVNTWTHPKSKAFWLKDFLPQQIPDARIMTFGYNADAAFGQSTAEVIDHAKSLLANLIDKREEAEEIERPLIFIAHSLGGIVVKQALLQARLEPRFQSISDATLGLIFLGTPHRGSEKASYGNVLANVGKFLTHGPSSRLLTALHANSDVLLRLNTDFRFQLPDYQVYSFYEQRPMKGLSSLIVEKHSAFLEINNEELIPVDADHSAMCKFETQSDDIFETVYKRIKRMRNNLLRITNEQSGMSTIEDRQVRQPSFNDAFDSGYRSMSNTVSKSNERNDDNTSIRSILSNASRVLLSPQENKNLIAVFAGDLCQDIGFLGDLDDVRDRISARLPDLLKTFTLRLEKSVNSEAERKAKEFVRQQRDHITYQLCEGQVHAEISEDEGVSTPKEDGMSVTEKMAIWNTAECSNLPLEPALVPDEEPLRFQELRSFLLDSPAYQWLVENARSSAILTERKGTIVDAIARKVDDTISSMRSPKSWRFQMFQINFNIHWDLPNFLMGQEYETTSEIAVEHAITVTGSGSNTQALSCMEYMRQTWPSSGREVLRMLQKALISPNLSYSSCLADGTELDISLRSPRVSVVARGGQAALTELCEQLAWLGAALQNSPVSSGVCLATPNITISKDAHPSNEVPSVTVQIAFTITPLPDHDLSTHLGGTCWHAMFRNPTVVNGFPILARHESEQGLELPLDLMSVLAEAHFATRYGTILLLKGLCTMLVPTRQTKNSVTWHFLLNEDGNRMPYYSFRERCPSWVGVDKVSMGFLEAGNVRHFVGWASHITRHLGTKDVKYEQIDWSGAKQCSPGLAIEQKLTISVSKILGGSMTAVRGNRDKPMYVKHSGYSIQIKQARKKYVVLYDTEAQRGWLIDGASALLHLVRTQTVQEPYGGQDSLFNPSKFKHPGIDQGPDAAENVLKDESNMQHVILREFSSYADETIDVPHHEAMSIVGEESDNVMNKRSENAPNSVEGRRAIYKTTCLRELVSQTWSTLELIFDHQTDVARTHTTTQLTNPFQTKLEGYEFMDIVSARTSLTRRAVELQSNGPTWIVLTRRIQAITLFGQHFGDMYKPTEDAAERICKLWQTVPQGHEYLAVPISLLKEIKQRSWEDGEIDASSPEIAKGLICSPSSDAFRTCEPCCKHSFIRVQQPCSSKPAEILARIAMDQKAPREVNPFVEINGALLFGKNSDLDVKKLEILSPPAVHKESSFHDSGIGPSLQFSSQASSSNTNPVTNPDTQPMRPWADSMGTSPSPLDQTRPKNTSGDRTKSLSLRQSDDDTTARRASLSQQALSPGPASVNKSTDVPFSDQAHSWRRSLVASLEKVATRIIPSWRKRAVTIAPRR